MELPSIASVFGLMLFLNFRPSRTSSVQFGFPRSCFQPHGVEAGGHCQRQGRSCSLGHAKAQRVRTYIIYKSNRLYSRPQPILTRVIKLLFYAFLGGNPLQARCAQFASARPAAMPSSPRFLLLGIVINFVVLEKLL